MASTMKMSAVALHFIVRSNPEGWVPHLKVILDGRSVRVGLIIAIVEVRVQVERLEPDPPDTLAG